MTVLLYFASFVSVFALLASVTAGTFWLLTKCLRALIAPAAPKRSDAAADFHPHHLKRAGQ